MTRTREKLNHLMKRVHVHLTKLEPHDEAYEAYGRAYWLDEHDGLCSMKLRPTYDVLLEPDDPTWSSSATSRRTARPATSREGGPAMCPQRKWTHDARERLRADVLAEIRG
jgi:hypothetical protein